MRVDSFQNLFVDHLRELYNAEMQIIEALPKMATGSTSGDLKEAFKKHLRETKTQVTRLKHIFKELDEDPEGIHCEAMEGLIKEVEEILKKKGNPLVKDAALISAAQNVEHYEIAGYGTLRTYAKLLNLDKAEELLNETMEEEANADKELTKLAAGTMFSTGINQEAAEATLR